MLLALWSTPAGAQAPFGYARPDSLVDTAWLAAHLQDLFVLHLLGYDSLRLYLGSWQDWGNRLDLPLATVAADGKP
jgi:hypothetical protein